MCYLCGRGPVTGTNANPWPLPPWRGKPVFQLRRSTFGYSTRIDGGVGSVGALLATKSCHLIGSIKDAVDYVSSWPLTQFLGEEGTMWSKLRRGKATSASAEHVAGTVCGEAPHLAHCAKEGCAPVERFRAGRTCSRKDCTRTRGARSDMRQVSRRRLTCTRGTSSRERQGYDA